MYVYIYQWGDQEKALRMAGYQTAEVTQFNNVEATNAGTENGKVELQYLNLTPSLQKQQDMHVML